MKRIIILIIAVCFVGGGFSAFADEYEKVSEESFSVSKNASLTIQNRYGDILLNTWDKDEVKITVSVICETARKDKADRFFEKVDIEIQGNKDAVRAETHLRFNNSKVKSFAINYTIYAPASLTFYLNNRFGDVFLPDLGGALILDLQYGEFSVGRLLNDKNQLDIAFSEGEIAFFEAGLIDIEYSELEIESAKIITVDSDFSDISIEKAALMNVETGYDEIEIGEVDELIIESDFSEINITLLNNRLNGNLNYGELDLERTRSSVSDIYLTGKFTEIYCGLNAGITWKFLANAEFTDIDFSHDVNYIGKSDENTFKKIYSGLLWDKKDPSAVFTLEAKNCDVKIEKL